MLVSNWKDPSGQGINLDAQTPEDLKKFSEESRKHPRLVGRVLFPDRPSGYVHATSLLSSYASQKLQAMECRVKGLIESAQFCEDNCDSTYKQLPEYARW